jgi:hypothetical protein
MKEMILKSLIISVIRKLGWHPHRCLTFASLVEGLIDQGSVQHHRLSRGLTHKITFKAKLEKIRRFFAYQEIDPVQLSHAWLMHIYGKMPKMDLMLDRTNWKFGETDINYLVLAARINRHIVFPIAWVLLPHQGNSDTDLRIELLESFRTVFGFACIRSFSADREFIGHDWLDYLCQHNVPFLSV